MFTAQQLQDAHAKVKSGADFPAYAQEIKDLGVYAYDFLVEDGAKNFYGENVKECVNMEGNMPRITVAELASKDKLKAALLTHQQGKSDFLTFRQQAAEAGVAQWSTDLVNMEVVYISKQQKVMLAESIPA